MAMPYRALWPTWPRMSPGLLARAVLRGLSTGAIGHSFLVPTVLVEASSERVSRRTAAETVVIAG